MCAYRVLGVGSPNGDDAAGWCVVEMLRRRPGLSVQLAAVGPAQLLDHLTGCQILMVVDGCRTNQAPGTVLRLQWPDARLRCRGRQSSHGFSVGDALTLGEMLGRLPPRVVVWGVELSGCGPGEGLSPEVRAALPDVERRILHELSLEMGRQNHD